MPQDVPEDRPHNHLTRSILESAMRVQSTLGVGLYEKPYKVCLAHALRLSCKEVGLLLNFWACPLKDGGIQRLVLSRDRA